MAPMSKVLHGILLGAVAYLLPVPLIHGQQAYTVRGGQSYSIAGHWHWRADCGIGGAWHGSFQFDEPSNNQFKGRVTANIPEPGMAAHIGACPPPIRIRDGRLKGDSVSFIKESCGGDRPQPWTGKIVRGSDNLLHISGTAIADSSKRVPFVRDWWCSWTAYQDRADPSAGGQRELASVPGQTPPLQSQGQQRPSTAGDEFTFNVLTELIVDRANHRVEFFGAFDPRGPAKPIPYEQLLTAALRLPEESGQAGAVGAIPSFSLEPTNFSDGVTAKILQQMENPSDELKLRWTEYFKTQMINDPAVRNQMFGQIWPDIIASVKAFLYRRMASAEVDALLAHTRNIDELGSMLGQLASKGVLSKDDAGAVGRAFETALTKHVAGRGNLLFFPAGSLEQVLGLRISARPTFFGIPSDTAFARAIYESDVALKSLVGPAGQALKQAVPTHETLLEWIHRHADLNEIAAGTKLWAIQVRPADIQLSVSEDLSFLRFDAARLRIEVRGRAANQMVPASITRYADFLTEHYEDYAREIAPLWEIREAFKVVAAARYLKDNGLTYEAAGTDRAWRAPAEVPAHWDVAFLGTGGQPVLASMFAGGVDIQVRKRTRIAKLSHDRVPSEERLRFIRVGNLLARNAPLPLEKALSVAAHEKLCLGHGQCNYFAGAVGAVAGIPYFRDMLTDPVAEHRVANEAYKFIANAITNPSSSHWREIKDMNEVQRLANEGKFVVVVAQALKPGESGHIGFAAPERLAQDSTKVPGDRMPWIRDSKNSSKSVTANWSFNSMSGLAKANHTVDITPPIWAVWEGPVCSSQGRCAAR
jgi:hypothetical protein